MRCQPPYVWSGLVCEMHYNIYTFQLDNDMARVAFTAYILLLVHWDFGMGKFFLKVMLLFQIFSSFFLLYSLGSLIMHLLISLKWLYLYPILHSLLFKLKKFSIAISSNSLIVLCYPYYGVKNTHWIFSFKLLCLYIM